jgi:hypothetical protein
VRARQQSSPAWAETLMQADAYAGFNRLYEAGRKPGPITASMCWAHARRKFFDVARLNKAPIAAEAVENAAFAHQRCPASGRGQHQSPCKNA